MAAWAGPAAPVAARSMLGYMMRYHPAIRHLARMDLGDIYRARFEIGHDVRQWRQNWRFGESYAAEPQGGGVLLDLCHELDMALTLFPDLALCQVTSLGHARYPGGDFCDEIALAGRGLTATVAMDYLSPVFLRRLSLRGTRLTVEFDLQSGRSMIATDGAWEELSLPFERNRMFLDAMGDFLALVAGRPVSDVEHLPRLDLALPSARMIVEAYQARRFTGTIAGDY
jgi:predicted dehydrogenase